MEIVKPRVIVCPGSLAARILLDPRLKITEVRGTWFERDGVKLMPVLHPAAILRDRNRMDQFIADLREAGAVWKRSSQPGGNRIN